MRRQGAIVPSATELSGAKLSEATNLIVAQDSD